MSERVYIPHPKEPWGLSVRSATHTASEHPLGLEERMMVAQFDELTSLRTLVGELSRTAERIKVKLEDALPYIGNPANPSHIPRAAINEAIDQLTAVLAKADKIGGA